MLSLSGKALVICHPERSEGSPGKAKPSDLMLSVIFNPQIPPFREYALPLKRESIHEDWSTNDNTAAPTFIAGILHFVQNDICHVERKYAVQK